MPVKIFISYSWTSPAHSDWVIGLAERLVSDGVDVVIDRWALKEGNDLYSFMEKMVNSPDIEKVLIISDRKYSEKANGRSGGVGTETQIISPEIYKNVSQEKFIPIVSEKDENDQAFLPTFLQGKVYIDFTSSESFESNYEVLLRNLYGRPALSKPKLGSPPAYLFEDTPVTFKTAGLLRTFDAMLDKNPARIKSISKDFLDNLFENLKALTIEFHNRTPVEVGRAICENLNQYAPLKNDFVNFIDRINKNETNFDKDNLVGFFEKLPSLLYPQGRGSWQDWEFGNFRFVMHELFLSMVATGLKNNAYGFLEEVMRAPYYVEDRYEAKKEPDRYSVFYHPIDDIIKPYYTVTFSQNFFSASADLMAKRVSAPLDKNILLEADLLCHYIAVLDGFRWFPLTYVYRNERMPLPIFTRMSSAKHFDKVKALLGVSGIEELKTRLAEIKAKDANPYRYGYAGSFDSVSAIYEVIDVEKVGKFK